MTAVGPDEPRRFLAEGAAARPGTLDAEAFDAAIEAMRTISGALASAPALASILEVVAQQRGDWRLPDASASRQAEAMLAISKAAASAPNLPVRLDLISVELAKLIPHDRMLLYQPRRNGGQLETIVHRRQTAEGPEDRAPVRTSVDRGVVGSVFTTGDALLLHDAHLDAESPAADSRVGRPGPGGEQAMIAPLTSADRVNGVLVVTRERGALFTEEQFQLFRILAEHVAVAIRDAAHLVDAHAAQAHSARQAANLEAVLATTHAIATQTSLEDTLNVLADHLEALILHPRLEIMRLDRATGYLQPIVARDFGQPQSPDWLFPANRGLIGRAMRRGGAMMVNDVQLDPDAYFPATFNHLDPVEHVLIGPLRAGDEPIGVVVLTRCAEDRFTLEEVDIFQVLAAQAGIAIQTAMLLDEERRQHRHATALVEAAATLNRAGGVSDLMVALHSAVAATVDKVRSTWIAIFDPTATETVTSSSSASWKPDDYSVLALLPPSAFAVDREIVATGRAITGERLRDLMRIPPHIPQPDRCTLAALPLRFGRQVQGVLYVSGDQPPPGGGVRELDADELALLEAICDQAGTAIERSRLHLDTERRMAEMRLVGLVTEAVARSHEVGAIFEVALRQAQDVVPFTDGGVALWDEAAKALRVVHTIGWQAEHFRAAELPLDRSICGLVFQTSEGRTGTLGDGVPFVPSPVHTETAPVAYLCVPIEVEGSTFGSLLVHRHPSTPFSEQDLALFRVLADQIAVGIQRIRLYAMAVESSERSERQATNLRTVIENSRVLALQDNLPATLQTLGDGLYRLAPYSGFAIYRADEGLRLLRRLQFHMTDGRDEPPPEMAFGACFTGRVAETHQAVSVAHAELETDGPLPPAQRQLVLSLGLHLMAVPLLVDGGLWGVVRITRVGGEPFDDEEFAAVQVYAAQVAATVRNAELVARNRELHIGGVRALAAAIDAKDTYTSGHSERVSQFARRLSEELGLPADEAEQVELAGLLHDIGKIGIPDAILQKAGPLDDAERAILMGHAALGADLVLNAKSEALRSLVPLVRHHHEWVNGRGYPDGLSHDQIPLGAAIIAVADAWDTMTTPRPYRPAITSSEALAELRQMAGTQFQSDVVDAVAHLVAHGAVAEPILDPSAATADDLVPAMRANGHLPSNGTRNGHLGSSGQLGDVRALGLLVELARLTGHIPDLDEFLHKVADLVGRQLDYDDVLLMLVDDDRQDLVLAAHRGISTDIPKDYRHSLDIGVCGEVARTGEMRNVPDIAEVPTWSATGLPGRWGSELAVPLVVDGNVIGVITVGSRRVAAFTNADAALLTAAAGQVATAVHVAQLHAAAKHAAATDGLTRVSNHRAFFDALLKATNGTEPLCVMMLDVVGLKQVNDTAGHLAGDALLRAVAEVIRRHVRPTDVIARYGGDEFAIILKNVTYEQAVEAGRRIRTSVIEATTEMGLPPTAACFGAALLPDDGIRPYDLIAAADRRLYEMKATQREGRDFRAAALVE